MNKKNNEINNKIINMNELLNQFTIYIPDMQRDYCWGLNKKDDKTLFHEFLDTLYNLYKNKDDFTMGLFYGYLENDRLYLCDGQQRITSLYLILLYAYKLGKVDESLLIHSNMPSLQYAVRDSSLFFLSDLINNKIDIDNIENIINSDWYFDEYNNDDTIKNMLASIKTIMGKKNIINDEFISYILNKINFIFIDMKTREIGEETYVLLNTTGESLSEMENLKPYLVFDDDAEKINDYTDKWEEMEHFFWIKTNQNYEMAEKCFIEFLRWVVKLTCYEKSTNILKEKDILYNFFTKKEEPAIKVIKEYFDMIFNEEINPLLDVMGIKLKFNGEHLEDKKIYSLFAAIYGNINNIPKDSYFYKIFKNIINRENKGGIEKITSKNVVEFLINHESKDILETLEKDSFLKNDVEEHLKLALYNGLNNKNELLDLFETIYSFERKDKDELFKILKYRALLLIDATVYEIKPYENIMKNKQKLIKIKVDNQTYDNKFEFLKDTIINNANIFMQIFEDNIKIFKSEIVEKIANNELIINMLTYDAPEYPVTNKISDIARKFHDSPHICIYGAKNISKWFYNDKINYKEQILFLNRLFIDKKPRPSNNKNIPLNQAEPKEPNNTKWLDIKEFNGILKYTKHRRFGFNKVFYARRYINIEYEINLYTILLFHKFLQDINRVNTYLANYNKYRDENKDILKEEYQEKSKIFIWDKNIEDKEAHYNRYGGIICIEKIINDKTLVIDIYAKNEKEFILQVFFRNPHNITQNDIDKIHDIKFELIEYDVYKQVRYEAVIEHSSYENIVALCDKILESIN